MRRWSSALCRGYTLGEAIRPRPEQNVLMMHRRDGDPKPKLGTEKRGNRKGLCRGRLHYAAVLVLQESTNLNALRKCSGTLRKGRCSPAHFNVADLVSLKAFVAAAGGIGAPVLVGASKGERGFFGTRQLTALVKSLRKESGLPVFLTRASNFNNYKTRMALESLVRNARESLLNSQRTVEFQGFDGSTTFESAT